MKILILDDNPMMRRLIGTALSDLVSEIVECGDEALDADRRRQHLPKLHLKCEQHREEWQ